MVTKWILAASFTMVLMMIGRAAAETDLEKRRASLPVIDMHCHTAGLGYGGSGCFVSDRMRNSWKLRPYLNSFGVTRKELETHGDAIVIDRIADTLTRSTRVDGAVILAMDGVVGQDGQLDRRRTEIYVPNDFLAEHTARFPHLYFGASINPYRPDAIERLRKAAENGAVLVKWLPSVMAIDPADPAIIPFYREMVRLQLPLLTHTGSEHSFTHVNADAFSDPMRLRLPLETGVTVVAAHMGGGGRTNGESNVNRLRTLMGRYANLYADISSLTQVNRAGRLVAASNDTAFTGRLAYGTDFPLIETPLCWPVFHIPAITTSQAATLARIANPWDRDVALRTALGMSKDILTRPAILLRIHQDRKKTIVDNQ